MKLRTALFALSLTGLTGVALAKAEPNCEVKGKKVHVKSEAACTKKKGTWLAGGSAAPADKAAPAAAAAPADTTTSAPAPAAGGAAAPAAGEGAAK